ncbi:hypothetical protein NFI96_004439 [Prochilodus magdalenae]|nr:hypothetical protein NFI96_004439 [Prochilodus magdalenae]
MDGKTDGQIPGERWMERQTDRSQESDGWKDRRTDPRRVMDGKTDGQIPGECWMERQTDRSQERSHVDWLLQRRLAPPASAGSSSVGWLLQRRLAPLASTGSSSVDWLLQRRLAPLASTGSSSVDWLRQRPLAPPASTGSASVDWLLQRRLAPPASTGSSSVDWLLQRRLAPPASTGSASVHWLRQRRLAPPASTGSSSRRLAPPASTGSSSVDWLLQRRLAPLASTGSSSVDWLLQRRLAPLASTGSSSVDWLLQRRLAPPASTGSSSVDWLLQRRLAPPASTGSSSVDWLLQRRLAPPASSGSSSADWLLTLVPYRALILQCLIYQFFCFPVCPLSVGLEHRGSDWERQQLSHGSRAGSANAEGHSAQRSPTFYGVHHYRPPDVMCPSDQLRNSVESFMEWVSMAEQLHPSLTSPRAVQSVERSGVKLRPWTLEQWRSRVVIHTSPSGSLMDKSRFGGIRRTKRTMAVLDAVTVVCTVSVDAIQDGDTYNALLDCALMLNKFLPVLPPGVESSLPLSEMPLQQDIHWLCECWWRRGLQGKEELGWTAFVVCLESTVTLKKPVGELNRLYGLKQVLLTVDFDSERGQYVTSPLLQCFLNTNHIKREEGKRFLAFLFGWDVNFIRMIHETIKNQLPFFSKAMATDVAEIYFRAWKKANSPFLEEIESSCIQDFMQHALLLHKTSPVHPKVRQILSYFHKQKFRQGIDEMLHRLYKPILWKALKVEQETSRVKCLENLRGVPGGVFKGQAPGGVFKGQAPGVVF